MPKAPHVFADNEIAVLSALYEAENGSYDSYSLTQKLSPTAFSEVRDATERLIARSLVSGKRSAGADGVYFRKLKLTSRGMRTALQQRELVQQRRSLTAIREFLSGKPKGEIDFPKPVAEFLGIDIHTG